MIKNLGRVLTILALHEASEIFAHEDVRAFGAPSECHDDVSRGEPQRFREARRHAESEARRPLKIIFMEAEKRAGMTPLSGDPKWQAVVGRIYRNRFPF